MILTQQNIQWHNGVLCGHQTEFYDVILEIITQWLYNDQTNRVENFTNWN